MATLTLGASGQPSAKTINLDALFSLSVENSRKQLFDNISSSNAVWKRIIENGAYESADGGTHIEEPLMYALGNAHWFDGFDVLKTDTINGITKALYEWRQASVPIVISGKEIKQNKHKIVDLFTAKIQQASLGIEEMIPKAMFQGNQPNGGSIVDAVVDSDLGATGINTLASMVHFNPSSALTVGNIAQGDAANSWWRNQQEDMSGDTLGTTFLDALSQLYMRCSRGPGGSPDFAITDEESYALLESILYHRTRHPVKTNQEFPFDNILFKGMTIVHDEFMHDAANGNINTTTAGTLYMLNTKFWKIRYESDSDFVTTDPRIPTNQDAMVKFILWMGNMTCNNRRKQGVAHGILRSGSVAVTS